MSTYTKTTFVEGGAPGISAAELNKLGQGVQDAHTEIDAIAKMTFGTYNTLVALNPNQLYTINIPIGTGKTRAEVKFNSYCSTGDQVGGIITCTTTSTESISFFTGTGSPPAFYSILRSENANYLIDQPLFSGNSTFLVDCYINGTNLTLTFKNINAGSMSALRIDKLHWWAA